MSYNITHNDLPQAVALLMQKVDALTQMIEELPKPKAEKEILTIDEAAELLQRKRSTMYIYASTGKIPHIKNKGRLMFSRSDLMDWLSTGKVKTLEQQIEDRLSRKKK